MRVSPINSHNNTLHAKKFNTQKSLNCNPKINFQGVQAQMSNKYFLAMGGTLITLLCADSIKKDKEEKEPTYTDRDYHYDHPSPNDDWPDTAF